MPASLNGAYGTKPLFGRISFKDAANTVSFRRAGQASMTSLVSQGPGLMVMPTVVGVVGVVGHFVETLCLVFKSQLSTET